MRERTWPLAQLRRVYRIRRAEIMARAGVGDAPLKRLERGDVGPLQVRHLVAVAHALGVAPASLIPGLEAVPPRPGLVQERGAERAQARGARGR